MRGKSSRMHTDKAFLIYHDKPQCYHLYQLLEKLCSKVLISCNNGQSGQFDPHYSLLIDDTDYRDCGPIASALSAFKKYPAGDLLILGCDYPYLSLSEIERFLEEIPDRNTPAAFFNTAAGIYEPLLAWYPAVISQKLDTFYQDGNLSLQKFLKANNAFKYIPRDNNQLLSVDSPKEFIKAKEMIKKLRLP